MMMYVRAEREADWALHLAAVKLMIPSSFHEGSAYYAHHNPGIVNGIWSDMFIETTFI